MTVDKRKTRRRTVTQEAIICDGGGALICGCTLRNVSKTGGQIRLAEDREIPDEFVLVLSRVGRVRRRCVTVWRDGTQMGVKFLPPLAAGA